jgi:predicted DNA-binding protein
MAVYTRRAQTVLSEEQYEELSGLSEKTGVPISVLIRQAVEKVYFERADRERRQQALQRMLALDAPVADWEQMEDEIVEGAVQ